MPSRTLARGVYVPVLTYFNDDAEQSLDLESHKAHILWLAKAGVHGFLVQGSTAEAVALTPTERNQLTSTTRKVLDDNGFQNIPVIVGTGGQSTLESVAFAKDAAVSGGDYVIALPPSYFAGSITTEALEGYYLEIADKSPLPVLIYSYPGVSGGIDITSDSVATLSKHKNIVGIKQTDHNVGKMARIYYETRQNNFLPFAGASDYLLGALAVGAHGCITGLGNITPRVILQLFDLYEAGDLVAAREIQGLISVGEWATLAGGVPSMKAASALFLNRGGVPRRPIPASNEAVLGKLKSNLGPLFDLEKELEIRQTK